MRRSRERGATAIQILVILVPVFFGFMGFAIDLGRMYLIRGELKTAANAMALAAAQRLIGTEASIGQATAAAHLAIGSTANRFDFGGITIGEGSGRLASAMPEPAFYETASGATGDGEGGGETSGNTARYVRVDVTADAPLIFWGFLSLGQERRTPIATRAVAGVSAPLCTACGIEAIAIAPVDAQDPLDFGFSRNQKYTFGYFCNGSPVPSGLQDAPQRVPYMLLNRYNEEATVFPDETSQIFRVGVAGLPPNTAENRACIAVNAQEGMWISAQPGACDTANAPQAVTAFMCGLYTRFDVTLPAACENITDAAAITSAFPADTDTSNLDDWAQYTGNLRRVITVPVVDVLSPGATWTVLGFRQFLVQPNPGDTVIGPGDFNGRFIATYLGAPVPLRAGSFAGCSTANGGPGKVVLHQ